MLKQFALLTVAIVALTGSVLLRDSIVGRQPDHVDALLQAPRLPASVMRLISLGFESAVADVSYLQAIQIFGEKRFERDMESRVVRSTAVARLLDHATDLDPRFDYAYIFGAYAIPVPDFDRRTHNVDRAIDLLRKGVGNGGDDWRIPFNLGYQHSLLGEFEPAARMMAEAARRPGRPSYLPLLVTRMAAHGSSLDTSIALAQAMLSAAATDEQREELAERVHLLAMERGLRTLEKAIERFTEEYGRPPARLDELVALGVLDRLPEEPHGGHWQFDHLTGKVSSDAAERLRVSQRFLQDFDEKEADPAAEQPTTQPAQAGTPDQPSP